MERQSGWKRRSKEEIKEIFAFCEGYKQFLDRAKTEREAVGDVEKALVEHGFATDLKGPKVYRINRGKEVIAFGGAPGTSRMACGSSSPTSTLPVSI